MPIKAAPARMALARVVAITGTLLAGAPLAAPIVLAVGFLVAGLGLHLDFLMPGELFLVGFSGGALLVVAALLSRRRRRLLIALTGVVGVLFATVGILASATGLASGAEPATGWRLAVVLVAYVLYVASLAGLLVAGILLCRETLSRPLAAGASGDRGRVRGR